MDPKHPNRHEEQGIKSLVLNSQPLGMSSLEFKRELRGKDESIESEIGYPLDVFLVSHEDLNGNIAIIIEKVCIFKIPAIVTDGDNAVAAIVPRKKFEDLDEIQKIKTENNRTRRLEELGLMNSSEVHELLERTRKEAVEFSLTSWGFGDAVIIGPAKLEIMREITCEMSRRLCKKAEEISSKFLLRRKLDELGDGGRTKPKEPKHIPAEVVFKRRELRDKEDMCLEAVLERLLGKQLGDLSEDEVSELKEYGNMSVQSALECLLEKKLGGLSEEEASKLREGECRSLKAKLKRIGERRLEGVSKEEALELKESEDRSFGALLERLLYDLLKDGEFSRIPGGILKHCSVVLKPDGKFEVQDL